MGCVHTSCQGKIQALLVTKHPWVAFARICNARSFLFLMALKLKMLLLPFVDLCCFICDSIRCEGAHPSSNKLPNPDPREEC